MAVVPPSSFILHPSSLIPHPSLRRGGSQKKTMINIENNFNRSSDCRRKEDLVAYLYQEASAAERASFERHLDICDSCRGELSAFTRVRENLSAWQVGFSPYTEIAPPRSTMDQLREFIALFPAWARGAALTSAAFLLFALPLAGKRVISSGDPNPGSSTTSEQIETLIKDSITKERAQMREEYRAQIAIIKQQLEAQHEAQIQALGAAQQAKLEALKANLKAEINKSKRQNPSIRSFFAVDDYQDQWGDVR
jgi:Putative zinc-finger